MRNTLWDDIRQSIYNLFDHKLMEQGAYVNIATGTTNNQGVDLSRLYPVVDTELPYSSGQIWQSPFHNFVYESGVQNLPSPILASGIYVNGVFMNKASGVHIDYGNGRFILDAAIATTGVVQAAYSYKEYSFLRPDNRKPFVSSNKYVPNSRVYINPFPATPDTVYLPAMFIEIEYATEDGFEFGGPHNSQPQYKITLLSDTQTQVEQIASVLCNESTRSVNIVAAHLGPQFDLYGDLSTPYSFYQWCGQNNNFAYLKSVKYSRLFFRSDDGKEPELFGGVVNIDISAIR